MCLIYLCLLMSKIGPAYTPPMTPIKPMPVKVYERPRVVPIKPAVLHSRTGNCR